MLEFLGRFFIYLILCGIGYYVVKSIYEHNGLNFHLGGSQFWLGVLFYLIIHVSYNISKMEL